MTKSKEFHCEYSSEEDNSDNEEVQISPTLF